MPGRSVSRSRTRDAAGDVGAVQVVRRPKKAAVVALSLVALSTLAACGDDPAPGVGAEGVSPTVPPAAAGGGGSSFGGAITTISAEEARVLVENRPDLVILDVRSPEEFAEGHLPGARLLDFNAGDFQAELPTLDPNGVYLLYCRSGNRSGQAAQLMGEAGFTEVYDAGALADWAAAGGEVVTE